MKTPTTLKQAIENGMSAGGSLDDSSRSDCDAVAIHVRDFLAQKFTPDLMENPNVRELWQRITAKAEGT